MVIEWREREKEDVDAVVEGNLRAHQALKIYGIYSFGP